jgi:hypothetical protein
MRKALRADPDLKVLQPRKRLGRDGRVPGGRVRAPVRNEGAGSPRRGQGTRRRRRGGACRERPPRQGEAPAHVPSTRVREFPGPAKSQSVPHTCARALRLRLRWQPRAGTLLPVVRPLTCTPSPCFPCNLLGLSLRLCADASASIC